MKNKYPFTSIFLESGRNLNKVLLLVFLSIGYVTKAQFNTPTVNGAIAAGEYGSHVNGQNQQTQGGQTWFMTWDNTNLYVAVSNANTAEGTVIYFDTDVLAPINGGTNANGTNVGQAYDNTNFASLPFRADLVLYVNNGYREFRTRNGSNGWSAATVGFGNYAESGGNIREFSIPWSSFPTAGRPAQFAWFGYVTTSGGNAYTTMPAANPTGSVGLSARWERYFKVDGTNDGSSVLPFSRDSYVFNLTASNNAFGAINVWDFTMNSASLQISRGTTGGNWTINGTLVVNAGSVFFGPSGGPFGTTNINNITVNSGALLDMDFTSQPINLSGNFFCSGTFSMSQVIGGDLNILGNFTHQAGTINATGTRARAVNFNGTAAQTITPISTGTTLSFVNINNTNAAGVTLSNAATSSLTVNNQFNVAAGSTFTVGANTTLTLATTCTGTLPSTSVFNFNGNGFTVNCTTPYNILGTLNRNNASGTITSTTATLTMGANSVYNHNANGTAPPTASWNATSNCNILGLTTNNLSSFTGTFGNITWNNPTQTSTGVISGALTAQGNLTVTAGTLNLNGQTLTVGRDVVNNGTINSATAASTLALNGTLAQTISGTGTWTTGTAGRLLNLTVNNTSGSNPAVSLNTSLALQAGITLTNGILGGSGTLTLGIGAAGTFTGTRSNGSISNIGLTTNYNLGSMTVNVVYNAATGLITTGLELPSTSINGLTINSANHVVLDKNITILTNLTLTTGQLRLGSFNLTHVNAATLTGGSTTSYVAADGSGQFFRVFATGANSFNFPVGNIAAGAYTPVNINYTANSVIRTVGVRVTDAQHPNDLTASNFISRYWSFTDNAAGTFTYNATFTYLNSPADINGSGFSVNRWNGSSWTPIVTTGGPAPPLTINGLTEVTAPLNGSEFTARINPPNVYTWIATSGAGNWTNATNWSPARTVPFSSDVLQFINGGTPTVTNVPTQTIGRLIVDNNTNVLLQSTGSTTLSLGFSGSTNVLNITSGANLQLASTGANALTLAFSTTTGISTSVAGSITINPNASLNNTLVFTNLLAANNTITGSVVNNGGVVTATAATTTFGAGSTYVHNMNGGTIPTPTWNATSTLQVTGITTTNPGGFSGTFGNLVWNCPAQTASGAFAAASTIAGNLTVSAGTINFNTFTINVVGNVLNNGTIITSAVGSTLNLNGTALQTISGTGTWTTGVPGRLLNLTLNNAAGASLNSNLAIQTSLTLSNGVLGGTGTLTLGVPATAITVTRTLGSITAPIAYNFTTAAYTLNYNGGNTLTTGPELPPAATPTNGVVTISVANTNVTLSGDANIGRITTSLASNTFNLASFTVGLSDATPVSNIGTITANAAGATLNFNGAVAQTFTLGGTYTGSLISNIVVNNTNLATGLSLGTNNINVGQLTVNSGSIFTFAGLNLNVRGNFTNNGTVNTAAASSTLTLNGTSLQTIGGSGVYTTGVIGRLLNLVINNAAGVNLNQSVAIQTALTLTSGVLNTTNASTLTFGIGATSTLTTTVTNGSIAMPAAFNLAGVTYNILYNLGTTVVTGSEMPPTSVTNYTLGTVTVANTNGVALSANANINNLTINAGVNFNLNGNILGIFGAYSNSGSLNGSAATSTLNFNGTAAQTFTPGTLTGGVLSNLVSSNTNAAGLGVATLTAGNVTVNPSSFLFINASATLNVRNNLTNNGVFNTSNTSANLVLNGTTPQIISGSGSWIAGGGGLIRSLTVNNASGVDLQCNVGVQNTLTLTAGDVSSSNASTFTLGGGFASTLNMTRSAGSLSVNTAYNLSGVTFNVVYGTGAPAITVGNELPGLPNIITGTFQVNNTNGVVLTKNIQVNSTWTFTAGNFTIGANTITLNGTITNTSGNFIGGATSSLIFSGAGGATTLGVVTNGLQDLTINRPGITITLVAASPLTIANNLNMTAGILSVNSNTLTVNGGFTGSGLGTVTGSGSLVFGGTSGGNMGTLFLTSGAQTFSAFTMNRTGAGASVTINGDLTVGTLTLTSGIVNMNNSRLIYTGNAAGMLAIPGSATAYFSFLGGNSGFQWNMSSIAPGTYRWPVGPAGVVNGFRPVTIQTTATTTSNVRIGFINHTGGSIVSGTNVVDDVNNQRVNFITNITSSAALTTPNLTLTYQDADFNNLPSGVGAVRPWRYNGTLWFDFAPQNGNGGPIDGNTTITKNTVTIAAGSNPYILAENINPIQSPNTYTWIGATSTAWATTTNWSPTAPTGGPGVGDNAIINNGTLANQPIITTGVTIANLTLSDGTLTINTPGTLTVTGSFVNTATFNSNASTSVTFNSASTQTIPIGNYNNLISTGTGDRILSPTGTINISGTFTPGTNSYTTAGSTVNFTAAASTIPVFTFNNLTVSSTTSGTLGGAITVNGNLFLNTPTFNDNGFQITGNASGTFTTAANTTLNLGTAATATQFPTNFTTANISLPIGATVNYNSNAAQSISGAPVYGNLTLTATSAVTKTLAANATVAGNLTVGANNTLNDNDFTLTARGNVVMNGIHSVSASGRILLASGTALHNLSGTGQYGNVTLDDGQGATLLTNPMTINGDLNVNSGAFTIPALAFTQAAARTTTVNSTLVISSATGAKTFGNVVVNNTGTWNNSGTSAVTIAGNLSNNGTFLASTGIYTLSGTTRTLSGAGALSIPNLTCSGSYTSSHPALTVNTALSVGGSFTNTGVLTIPAGGTISGAGAYINGVNGTLNYTSTTTPTVTTFTANAVSNLVVYNNTASAQTVRTPTSGQYHNLTINKAATTATLSGNTTVLNNLTILSGTLADGTFQLSGPGAGSGTLDLSAAATTALTLTNAATNPFPTFQTNTFHPTLSTVTVCIGTAAQNIPGLNYGNIVIGGTSATRTFTGAATVNGNFTTTGAITLADGGFIHTIIGNVSHAAAHTGTGRLRLGGTSVQTISGAGSYTNLEIDNTAGVTMLSSFTINGTPRLTAGNLSVGSNTLTLNGNAFIQTGGNLATTTTSNLTFSGTGIGHFIPNSVSNLGLLTLSLLPAGNGVTLNSNVQLNAATGLTFTNGRVVLGAFNLTLSSVSTISGTLSVNNMVVADGSGQLMKTFPAGSSLPIFTFPVGDVTGVAEYSPTSITFSSNSLQRTIGVRVTDAVHPNNGANPDRISRFWSFTDNQFGNGTYTYAPLSFTCINGAPDIDGNTANYRLNRYDGSTWYQYTTGTMPTFSTPGTLNEITGTLGGSDWTYRFNAPTTYTWIAPTASDWNIPSNWSPARIVPGFNDILIFNDAVTGTPTATNVPTQSISRLEIQGTTTVATLSTIGANTLSFGAVASSNILTVAPQAEMIINATGTNALSINVTGSLTGLTTSIAGKISINENLSGTNTLNFTNLTAANNTITGTIQNNGGTFTTTAATTAFGAGSVYQHNFVSNLPANIIPTATWNAASTVLITNANFAPTAGLNQTFGNLTINTAAALTTTQHGTVTLPGTLTLTQGTFAIAGNTLNLNGPAISQTSGTLIGATNSTLVFGPGVGNTNTGLFIPASVTTLGNLTLNIATTNSVTLSSNLSLNAATGLTLTGGRVVLGSNHLTFEIGSAPSAGSINSFVVADGTGELRRTFATGATSAFTYPVGDVTATADYSPYSITFSTNSTVRTIGVRVVDDTHPNNGVATDFVSRYWLFSDSQAGVGTYSYSSASFTYSTNAPTDANGSPANYRINRWDGSNWSQLNTSVSTPTYTTSATNTEISGTLAGNAYTLRLNPPQTYTWIGTDGLGGSALTGDFQTPSNWSPSRFSPQPNDILQFTLGGTPTANNVPSSQTIGRLVVDNNTNIQLQSAAAGATLSLGNSLGPLNVLSVTSGSTLQLSSTGGNQLTINFPLTVSNTAVAGTLVLNANTAQNNTFNFTNLTAANNIITGTIQNNGGIVTATTTTTTMELHRYIATTATGEQYLHRFGIRRRSAKLPVLLRMLQAA